MWFDADFSLSKHVQNVCESCFLQCCDLRHVRWFLNHDVSVLVANAPVRSQFDYCNSIFRSLSKFKLCKLQGIQNSAARYTSITLVLKINCIGFQMNIAQSLKQPPLFTSFSILVFPSILLHIFLPTAVLTVVPKFQPSIHKSVKQFDHGFAFDAPTIRNRFSLLCI